MSSSSGQDRPIKVYIICTGVSFFRGGVESFFRECFDGLHGMPGLHLEMLKGYGEEGPDEHSVWSLRRDRKPAQVIGKVLGRHPYAVEQVTALPGLIRRIRAGRPDILFSSDNNLFARLWAFRRRIGVPYRLLFSNGGPLPPPFVRVHHVQQVAPFYYEEAIASGEDPQKHSMVPYGINVPAGNPDVSTETKRALRQKLNLPQDRPIIISVGWVSPTHKRMDYTVREVAQLPTPRPFLLMVGRTDDSTKQVDSLARELLGAENFAIRSVPYEQVADHYKASDLFTLASLKEGFGRVYIEALIHGLPCVVHDQQVPRFVLNDQAEFADFTKEGAMAGKLAQLLKIPQDAKSAAGRRESVRLRFSWESLRPAYLEMFRTAVKNVPDPLS